MKGAAGDPISLAMAVTAVSPASRAARVLTFSMAEMMNSTTLSFYRYKREIKTGVVRNSDKEEYSLGLRV